MDDCNIPDINCAVKSKPEERNIDNLMFKKIVYEVAGKEVEVTAEDITRFDSWEAERFDNNGALLKALILNINK